MRSDIGYFLTRLTEFPCLPVVSYGGVVQRHQILGVLVIAFGGGLAVFVYASHYATKLVVNKNKEVRDGTEKGMATWDLLAHERK